MNFDDLMKKMKIEYAESLPAKVEELKELAGSNNTEDLKNFFHKLKGSGATYGFPEFTEYGKKFEDLIKSTDLDAPTLSTALTELQTLVEKVQN